MLEEALARNPTFPAGLADAAALPFADDSHDVVVVITALEFMAEPVPALREAIRVARRAIMVCVLNRWSLLATWRRIQGLFVSTPYDEARFLSAGELRRMLQQATPNLPAQVEMRTAVWPGVLSALEDSHRPWGAFLGMSVLFDKE